MAFVDHLDGSEISLDDNFDGQFYNVTMAVGTGAPNRRDDVMLVQYLLKSIYNHSNGFQPPLQPPAGGNMKIDGRFGGTTAKWIRHFQQQIRARGSAPIRTDGRVDRSDRGGISSISRTVYTIIALNKGLQMVSPEAFADLTTDPECPIELLRALGNIVIDVTPLNE